MKAYYVNERYRIKKMLQSLLKENVRKCHNNLPTKHRYIYISCLNFVHKSCLVRMFRCLYTMYSNIPKLCVRTVDM